MRIAVGQREFEIDDDVVERIRNAESACVLTGAGVSAESGVPTFRGAGGIWEKYDYRVLATPEGFRKDPHLVWEWYKLRQAEMKKAEPNPAHLTIAEMEDYYDAFSVLTQNIDGLHARAGSRNIVELHGNIWRMRCPRDGTSIDLDSPVEEIPPLCQCGSILRPDVVWFGEQLPSAALESASAAASSSEVMFVVGTSAFVYPAAALPVITKDSGGVVVEVNLEPTPVSAYADASLFGRAGDILPVFWQRISAVESFMTGHPIIRHR